MKSDSPGEDVRIALVVVLLFLAGCGSPEPHSPEIPASFDPTACGAIRGLAAEATTTYGDGTYEVWAAVQYGDCAEDELAGPFIAPTACRAFRGNVSYNQDTCEVFHADDAEFERRLGERCCWAVRGTWEGQAQANSAGADAPTNLPLRILAYRDDFDHQFYWDGRIAEGASIWTA